MSERYRLFCGDAETALGNIPTETVQTCITSPPYYQLRDYGVTGQIGLEPTIGEYIQKLVAVFREVKRVLKPNGTLWVNISDTCAGSGRNAGNHTDHSYKQQTNSHSWGVELNNHDGLKPKDLMLIPFELAKALRDDGWFLRQDIIWEKPNAMPESCKDRCTKSHEYIFLLSKSKRYLFNYLDIQEDCVNGDATSPRGSKGVMGNKNKGLRKTFRGGGIYTENKAFNNSTDGENNSVGNKPNPRLKRNKRSVWRVSTAHYEGDAHFATFPEKLITPCILAGSNDNDIVLDCFMGRGTTGVASMKTGRKFIGIELNKDYFDLSTKNIEKGAQRT